MKKTGEILKTERERQGISLEDVAITTKINIRVLAAMENGEQDGLPARSFLRGFVGSYAKFLGLNPKDVLKVFSEELGTTKPVSGQEAEKEKTTSEQNEPALTPEPTKIPSGPSKPKVSAEKLVKSASEIRTYYKKGLLALGAIILIGLIIFTKNMVDKYDRETVVEETLKNVENIEPVNSPEPPESVGGAEELIQESTPDTITTPEPTPELTATPESTPTPTPEPTPESTPEPAATREPTPKPNVGSIEVIIEALDKVEIDYRPDGGGLQNLTLEPESVHVLKANELLNIDVSDGGAISLKYNGKDMGVPGNLGQPIKLKFPR